MFKFIKYKTKNIEAKNCSTGEQKSILISIILSVAQIIKNSEFENSPLPLPGALHQAALADAARDGARVGALLWAGGPGDRPKAAGARDGVDGSDHLGPEMEEAAGLGRE